MNAITKKLLASIVGADAAKSEAFNIREDSLCAERASSKNIKITDRKKDGGGITVQVLSTCDGETTYVPACITHAGVDDKAYTDYIVEDGAKVTISAGCAVHTEDKGESTHKGIHLFVIGKNCEVTYKENHIGTGPGVGHYIDTDTEIILGENSHLYYETIQLKGVDNTNRFTTATIEKKGFLELKERLLTTEKQKAITTFKVALKGEDSAVDLVSRSVAKDDSFQSIISQIDGQAKSKGHSECDSILEGNGKVSSSPIVISSCPDAMLVHEAAIGKISGEQIQKLQTLGLTEEEAENWIIQGFLK